MRKHLSVFMLFVRSSFVPIVVTSLLMAAVQIGFYLYFDAGKPMLLEDMVDEARFEYFFVVAAALLTAELCKACTGRRDKPAYTLHRLSISPKAVFLWQSLCNALLLMVFFAVEIFTMLFISAHFASTVGEEYATGQSLMLAFYRSDFLHSLLPMEESSRWIRNVVYVLGMAVVCANSSRKLRLGKPAVFLPTVAFAFVSLTFVAQMGEGGLDGFCMAVLALTMIFIVLSAFTGGEEIEDEADEETP